MSKHGEIAIYFKGYHWICEFFNSNAREKQIMLFYISNEILCCYYMLAFGIFWLLVRLWVQFKSETILCTTLLQEFLLRLVKQNFYIKVVQLLNIKIKLQRFQTNFSIFIPTNELVIKMYFKTTTKLGNFVRN